MATTATELVEQIVAAAHRPVPRIVPSFHFVHKPTGREFSPYGVPLGIQIEDCERILKGYVYQDSDGTRYGKRFASEEEARQASQDYRASQDEEFRAALLAMTAEQLQAQAAYWLATL